MNEIKVIEIKKSVFAENEKDADARRVEIVAHAHASHGCSRVQQSMMVLTLLLSVRGTVEAVGADALLGQTDGLGNSA